MSMPKAYRRSRFQCLIEDYGAKRGLAGEELPILSHDVEPDRVRAVRPAAIVDGDLLVFLYGPMCIDADLPRGTSQI